MRTKPSVARSFLLQQLGLDGGVFVNLCGPDWNGITVYSYRTEDGVEHFPKCVAVDEELQARFMTEEEERRYQEFVHEHFPTAAERKRKRERQIAQSIFDDLVKMPIGTRTCTTALARPHGLDDIRRDDHTLFGVNFLLHELVRRDGRFILDGSHHAGVPLGLPQHIDFVLLKNNMQRYDKIANDFAVANGKYGAYFVEFWKPYICRYQEVIDDEWSEGENVILVEKNGDVRYISQQELFSMENYDPFELYPWGKTIYDSYKRKVFWHKASPYEKEIVQACNSRSFESMIEPCSMYRALEEAESLGMMVAIVPDPEFQPGGSKEGQCDGWTYHPEVVTKEEYSQMNK